MIRFTGIVLIAASLGSCHRLYKDSCTENTAVEQRVDSLLQQMTIEEKIGQMYQCLGRGHARVGDGDKARDLIELVRAGKVGSILVPGDVEDVADMQRIAVEESRLGIPLFFNYDVIHGFKTIFPIPLAMSCSWDTSLVRKAHSVAAIEAAAAGISYNHGPMADVSRDPRWGRVMEGNGEDPYLSSMMTIASVKGFQGQGIENQGTLMACVKHFIGYGGVEGGRDYNTVDIGAETVRNIHLPPFIAGLEASASSIMTSFNVVGSIPTVAHKPLLKQVLRKELAFDGIVISDFGSIGELLKHGYAATLSHAAQLALESSVDIEMQSRSYHENLPGLIREGLIEENTLDEAVGRILAKKFQLGLFDNPYRFGSKGYIDSVTLSKDHRKIARETAQRSMVLLKNGARNGQKVLPIRHGIFNIAVIGPFAHSKNILGRWSAKGDTAQAISLWEGMQNTFGQHAAISWVNAGDFWNDSALDERNILEKINNADLVVLALGEPIEMSAEAASRAILDIPGNQKRIAELAMQTGKPTVLVLFNGRPLAIPWYQENMDAILEVWYPGTEGGNAIAEVLAGHYNPSGRLTMTFPRHEGQIPVYYNHYNTGRPPSASNYSSKYIDIPNSPLYPFGFGLSYTDFDYSGLSIDKKEISFGEEISVSVQVTNVGEVAGEEVVQLYIRDHVAEVVRPVMELKSFKKIALKPGETQAVLFSIRPDQLMSWSPVSEDYRVDPGHFTIMIGKNSVNFKSQTFTLKD